MRQPVMTEEEQLEARYGETLDAMAPDQRARLLGVGAEADFQRRLLAQQGPRSHILRPKLLRALQRTLSRHQQQMDYGGPHG